MESNEVQLRPMPYPYRAMLAICSDLDETPDRHVYWEIMRFLNTTGTTAMGPGAGLEVGNSIYFDMPPGQFAYWNTDDTGRERVRALIRSGHIDCLHSYGDLATERVHAGRALDELARHDCKLEVWVDHGTAPTNFGTDVTGGHGDEVGHEAYHADLTVEHGVRYVWRGRVTSVTGQDVPPRFGGMTSGDHALRSARTLAKEVAKHLLARSGSRKYAMHGPNDVLRPAGLRDGRRAYEFLRCNPHWGGISSCDQGRHIGEVLTDGFLNRLIDRGGSCILYTHLGKIDDPGVPLNEPAVSAFHRLAEASQDRRILVTTTRRLLGFRRAMREVAFTALRDDRGTRIGLSGKAGRPFGAGLPASELEGLTFYVPDPSTARVVLDGTEVTDLTRNGPDHTARRSVSLRWRSLEFPDA